MRKHIFTLSNFNDTQTVSRVSRGRDCDGGRVGFVACSAKICALMCAVNEISSGRLWCGYVNLSAKRKVRAHQWRMKYHTKAVGRTRFVRASSNVYYLLFCAITPVKQTYFWHHYRYTIKFIYTFTRWCANM